MKKVTELLLIMLLALSVVFAFVACDETDGSKEAKTQMTLKLTSVTSDDALVDEELFKETETEYYVLTNYSFSAEDAKIVDRAKADEYYYTDLYTGERKDTAEYKAEKARLEELQTVTLPTAVKVAGVADSKLEVTAEQLASAKDGVVDLTNGATEDVTTVYVRAIEGSALLNHTEIVNLIVPDNYYYIGDSAFGGCSSLEEITLPFVGAEENALNGAKVFGYIFGTVTYTGGVSVAQNYNASGTATYFVPEKLEKVTVTKELPAYAFHNVSTVKEIVYNAVDVIPAYAFYGTGIKDANIPATVTEIGNGAFGNCASLMTASFTDVDRIGDSAFSACAKLGVKTGEFAVNAKSYIGANAFAGCTSIEKLTVGGGALVMADAFNGLSSLESVNLGKVTLSVGAFSNWGELLTVNYTAADVAINGFETLNISYAFVGGYETAQGTQKANIKYVVA